MKDNGNNGFIFNNGEHNNNQNNIIIDDNVYNNHLFLNGNDVITITNQSSFSGFIDAKSSAASSDLIYIDQGCVLKAGTQIVSEPVFANEITTIENDTEGPATISLGSHREVITNQGASVNFEFNGNAHYNNIIFDDQPIKFLGNVNNEINNNNDINFELAHRNEFQENNPWTIALTKGSKLTFNGSFKGFIIAKEVGNGDVLFTLGQNGVLKAGTSIDIGPNGVNNPIINIDQDIFGPATISLGNNREFLVNNDVGNMNNEINENNNQIIFVPNEDLSDNDLAGNLKEDDDSTN